MKKSINSLLQGNQIKYFFGRTINKVISEKSINEKLTDKKKKVDEKKKVEDANVRDKEDRKERDSSEIDQLFMAKCHLDIQRMPEKALKRA